MLTNSGIATIYIDICILLFILTLKAYILDEKHILDEKIVNSFFE